MQFYWRINSNIPTCVSNYILSLDSSLSSYKLQSQTDSLPFPNRVFDDRFTDNNNSDSTVIWTPSDSDSTTWSGSANADLLFWWINTHLWFAGIFLVSFYMKRRKPSTQVSTLAHFHLQPDLSRPFAICSLTVISVEWLGYTSGWGDILRWLFTCDEWS